MKPTVSQPLEGLVRPFQTQDGVLSRKTPKNKPVSEETAVLVWGRRANLNIQAQPPDFPKITFPPTDPPGEPPPTALIYDEIYRLSDTVRVENPDDPAQYVIVKRTVQSWFIGQQDGLIRIFNFDNTLEG